MKKQTKLLMNFALFMLLIVLTFYILLKDQNIFEVFDIIKSAKIEFILIGILCVAIYVICEAVNISRTLTALGEKSTFVNNINTVFRKGLAPFKISLPFYILRRKNRTFELTSQLKLVI